jgi:hypothetical protein
VLVPRLTLLRTIVHSEKARTRVPREGHTPQASSVSRHRVLRARPRALLARATRKPSCAPFYPSPSVLGSMSSFRFRAGTERSFASRVSPQLVARWQYPFPQPFTRPRLRSERRVPLQSRTGAYEAIGRHAWGQCPSPHQRPSCGLTPACSGLASLAADARR